MTYAKFFFTGLHFIERWREGLCVRGRDGGRDGVIVCVYRGAAKWRETGRDKKTEKGREMVRERERSKRGGLFEGVQVERERER